MSFYADLHVHSRYARATSRNADLVELAWWARRKGITVLGTGDFTHPVWFEELTRSLVPAEPGLYRLRDELDRAVVERLPPSCRGPLRFLLEV
jgi:DNA helicase II / ATP-dependent DNA helicase PcrA